METIGARITALIKELGMTRTKFGERIGIASSSISTICNGKNNPSNQTINVICKEFQVNRRWLETGEGDMFLELSDAEQITAWVNKMCANRIESQNADKERMDRLRLRLISTFTKISDEDFEVLVRIAESWLKEENDNQT